MGLCGRIIKEKVEEGRCQKEKLSIRKKQAEQR